MICVRCKRDITPLAPRRAWSVATVALWIGALVIAVLFSIPIGVNLVLAPAALVIGSAIGVAARRASEWRCPACHATVTPTATERARRPRGATAEVATA